MFTVRRPAINQNAKIARALIGSTFGMYSRFRLRMQTKQRPVDSFLMTQCSLQLCLFYNQTRHFIHRSGEALYSAGAHK